MATLYRSVVSKTSPQADEALTFEALGLKPALLQPLRELGYEEPTPIQAAAIPPLIDGFDLLGQAATGTGKTAAFALPMLHRRDDAARGKGPFGLVLVPTRELALQVSQALHRYGRADNVQLVAVYGGAPVRQQIEALKRGVDIVVATPGRALDLVNRRVLKLGDVRMVVLDEADEMLDMGFIEDIEAILEKTPEDRQTALFSATLPKRIDKLARQQLSSPVHVKIEAEKKAADEAPLVRQTAYVVPRARKSAALGRILDAEDPGSTIVFCRTRGGVDDLTELLSATGYPAEALHGGLTQIQRDKVMARLRSGATNLLVATDVAARGIDIGQLTHVVNYDLPVSPEAYVHRIGRVGRAGREGTAIALVEPRERRLFTAIEKLIGHPIHVAQVPSSSEVRNLRLQRTATAIREQLQNASDDSERLERYRGVLDELTAEYDVFDIAAAAIALAHEATQGAESPEADEDSFDHAFNDTPKRPPKAKGDKKSHKSLPDGVRLFFNVGRKAGITPGDLVGAITHEANIKGKDLGAIVVHEMYSLVEVPKAKANRIARELNHCTIKGRRVKVRLDRK